MVNLFSAAPAERTATLGPPSLSSRKRHGGEGPSHVDTALVASFGDPAAADGTEHFSGNRVQTVDLSRPCTIDALRDAPGPMTTKELARYVMAERGLNTADATLLQLFTRRTGALLRWQRKRGILRSVKDPKHGRFDLWEIAV